MTLKSCEELLKETLTQEFLNSYRGLLSLSGLPAVISDAQGRNLYEFSPMPEFCRSVCGAGQRGCCTFCLPQENDAADAGGTQTCPYGLRVCAIPIRNAGQPAMYLIGGGAYSEEEQYRKYMLDVTSLAGQRGLKPEAVAAACSLLPTESVERIRVHEQLCRYLAQGVAQELTGGCKPQLSVEKDILEKQVIEQNGKCRQIEVNSNFLFNMLNCVARAAYFEHAEKTESLIYCLSDILRFNSQPGLVLHTIRAELEHIEKYLYIQKARFQARLKYVIDVPEHICRNHIPGGVLQPLIDNALLHGILLRKDGGEVCLKAESHGNQIRFYIVDNGNGFSRETLETLRAGQFLSGDWTLCRINRQLKDYYGAACGLDVIKSDTSGSTILVTIAKERREFHGSGR